MLIALTVVRSFFLLPGVDTAAGGKKRAARLMHDNGLSSSPINNNQLLHSMPTDPDLSSEKRRRPLQLPPPKHAANDHDDGLNQASHSAVPAVTLSELSSPSKPQDPLLPPKPVKADVLWSAAPSVIADGSAAVATSSINTDNGPLPPLRSKNFVRLTLAGSLRDDLSAPLTESDPIHSCGLSVLSSLKDCPKAAVDLAHSRIHAHFPFKDVPKCWLRLYVEGSCWRAVEVLEEKGEPPERDWLSELVRVLDRAMIIAGGLWRRDDITWIFRQIEFVIEEDDRRLKKGEESLLGPPGTSNPGFADGEPESASLERPAKKQKVSDGDRHATEEYDPGITIPESFLTSALKPPKLRFPIARRRNLSMEAFQAHLDVANASATRDVDLPIPLIITDALEHWPALSDRPWKDPRYLLRKTLGGRRLVPVEIGRSYADEGWGQDLITFGEFTEKYMFHEAPSEHENISEESSTTTAAAEPWTGEAIEIPSSPSHPTGYLAQHDLFAQIPSLRNDIAIPDYCHTDAPSAPPPPFVKPVDKVATPLLNAWFGPAGTISPAHTDPYHNILAQVVGTKYVRLYAPGERAKMYPRPETDGDDGVDIDMSNNSRVDVGEAMELYEGWGEDEWMGRTGDQSVAGAWRSREEFEREFPRFKDARFVEAVLGPGECLYIPTGWWHYVRGLSASFSVSFWWN